MSFWNLHPRWGQTLVSLLLAVTLCSCATSGPVLDGVAIINKKSIKSEMFSTPKLELRVSGQSCLRSFFFIRVTKPPTLNEALENALSQAQGAQGLSHVVVESNFFMSFFYDYSCFRVTGTPVFLSQGVQP